MKRVLYPGSFDPITKGHMNVIAQATELFDEVVVAVMQNSAKKNPFFTIEERLELIKEIYKGDDKVQVISGNQAAVKVAEEHGCQAMLRGLRGVTDFDYELQLSTINKKISNGRVTTVCLFPDSDVQYISSSVTKEVFFLNEPITDYVEPTVEKAMIEKYPR